MSANWLSMVRTRNRAAAAAASTSSIDTTIAIRRTGPNRIERAALPWATSVIVMRTFG
jgi:hypothetical protein